MYFKPRNYNRRYKEDYGIIRTLYINLFMYLIAWPAALLLYKIKFEGWNNIDRKKRYVYTSNHQSYIDPPLVTLAANSPIAFMAKEELFSHKNILLRLLCISLGAFAVNRDKPEIATAKTVRTIASKTKWSIGIFPQGRTCKQEKEPFKDLKNGFVSISKAAKMDIVPVAICNFTGYAVFPLQKQLLIKIGKPISYELPESEIINQWVDFMEKECY